MPKQLDRFQDQSESRWPTKAAGLTGSSRKALSRYIGNYVTQMEQEDSKLLKQRQQTRTSRPPPPEWSTSGTKKVSMSRQEYIQKQNKLYRMLTGHESWLEETALESAADSQNRELMSSLELYMAALDEKIYMSADHSRAMIGVHDKMVRAEFDRLNEEKDDRQMKLVRAVVELRDLYRDLWMQQAQLSNQRDMLEAEASNLRFDNALQLAKVHRLQYASHSLGEKLVEAQKWRTKSETLEEMLAHERREKENLNKAYRALQNRVDNQTDLMKKLVLDNNDEPKQAREVEERIHALFTEVVKLRAVNSGEDIKAETPLEKLDLAFQWVETMRDEEENRISSVIESFAEQHRSREEELMTQAAVLERQKEILLARNDNLEQELDDTVRDMSNLEERTLSLVYLLKTARGMLDGIDSGVDSGADSAE